jgi:hypothetical protein
MSIKRCERCGCAFYAKRPHARYCSADCRKAAWDQRRGNARQEPGERVLRPARRCSRDGIGTRLYVTPLDIDVLQQGLEALGAYLGEFSEADDLKRKLDRAAGRVRRKEDG